MKKAKALAALALVLVLALVAFSAAGCDESSKTVDTGTTTDTSQDTGDQDATQTGQDTGNGPIELTLYFMGATPTSFFLRQRTAPSPTPRAVARAAMEELIKGPADGQLAPGHSARHRQGTGREHRGRRLHRQPEQGDTHRQGGPGRRRRRGGGAWPWIPSPTLSPSSPPSRRSSCSSRASRAAWWTVSTSRISGGTWACPNISSATCPTSSKLVRPQI